MPKPNQDDLRIDLLQMLEEPVSAARKREQAAFDVRVGAHADRLLLFGAGNLGRRALSVLRGVGHEPIGFVDNNPALWGRDIEGVKVFAPGDASHRFDPGNVGVLVTIWCGEATDKMSDRIDPLRALGFRNIALYGHLAWKYPQICLPHYALDLPSIALAQAGSIVEAFDLFEQRRSREIFAAHVRWRLHLEYDALPRPVAETIYFNDRLIEMNHAEFLIDGGAFTGDSIQSFLETFGRRGFRRIVSFEPDPANFSRLERYIAALPASARSKITPMACALGERSGMVSVEATGEASSRVGHGDLQVASRTIDDFADALGAPSFIKLDVEGYEPNALRGGRETMKTSRPVVAVCAYHAQNHLWEIPRQVAAMVSDYRYVMVPHLSDGWDLVFYAIPNERAKPESASAAVPG